MLVLADGTDADPIQAVLAGVRRSLADKVPERVAVVEAVLRNPLGKVDRRSVGNIVAERGEAV